MIAWSAQIKAWTEKSQAHHFLQFEQGDHGLFPSSSAENHLREPQLLESDIWETADEPADQPL